MNHKWRNIFLKINAFMFFLFFSVTLALYYFDYGILNYANPMHRVLYDIFRTILTSIIILFSISIIFYTVFTNSIRQYFSCGSYILYLVGYLMQFEYLRPPPIHPLYAWLIVDGAQLVFFSLFVVLNDWKFGFLEGKITVLLLIPARVVIISGVHGFNLGLEFINVLLIIHLGVYGILTIIGLVYIVRIFKGNKLSLEGKKGLIHTEYPE